MTQARTVVIGTWHEREAREITRCPGYYAADHETLRTTPGDYAVRLAFVSGYTVPMPYWLLIGLDTVRVSGALYSGFGGVNYAKTDLPAGEAVRYTVQMDCYYIRELVASGQVTLAPGFEWLLAEKPWAAPGAPRTWNAVRALETAQAEDSKR